MRGVELPVASARVRAMMACESAPILVALCRVNIRGGSISAGLRPSPRSAPICCCVNPSNGRSHLAVAVRSSASSSGIVPYRFKRRIELMLAASSAGTRSSAPAFSSTVAICSHAARRRRAQGRVAQRTSHSTTSCEIARRSLAR